MNKLIIDLTKRVKALLRTTNKETTTDASSVIYPDICLYRRSVPDSVAAAFVISKAFKDCKCYNLDYVTADKPNLIGLNVIVLGTMLNRTYSAIDYKLANSVLLFADEPENSAEYQYLSNTSIIKTGICMTDYVFSFYKTEVGNMPDNGLTFISNYIRGAKQSLLDACVYVLEQPKQLSETDVVLSLLGEMSKVELHEMPLDVQAVVDASKYFPDDSARDALLQYVLGTHQARYSSGVTIEN